MLDSSQQQKLRREDIRGLKEEIQNLNIGVRKHEKKQRERAKKVKEKHQ